MKYHSREGTSSGGSHAHGAMFPSPPSGNAEDSDEEEWDSIVSHNEERVRADRENGNGKCGKPSKNGKCGKEDVPHLHSNRETYLTNPVQRITGTSQQIISKVVAVNSDPDPGLIQVYRKLRVTGNVGSAGNVTNAVSLGSDEKSTRATNSQNDVEAKIATANLQADVASYMRKCPSSSSSSSSRGNSCTRSCPDGRESRPSWIKTLSEFRVAKFCRKIPGG